MADCSLSFEDEDLRSSPSWWAATVATYCPSRPGELLKSSSSKPSERSAAPLCMYVVATCSPRELFMMTIHEPRVNTWDHTAKSMDGCESEGNGERGLRLCPHWFSITRSEERTAAPPPSKYILPRPMWSRAAVLYRVSLARNHRYRTFHGRSVGLSV